jgi:hypothetical protein
MEMRWEIVVDFFSHKHEGKEVCVMMAKNMGAMLLCDLLRFEDLKNYTLDGWHFEQRYIAVIRLLHGRNMVGEFMFIQDTRLAESS